MLRNHSLKRQNIDQPLSAAESGISASNVIGVIQRGVENIDIEIMKPEWLLLTGGVVGTIWVSNLSQYKQTNKQ